MLIKGATAQQIKEALRTANLEFDNNLIFNRFDPYGRQFRVTLKVKDSKGKGARRSTWDGHRLISACWHAHGTFFDALPEGTVIVTGKDKTYPGAPWHDWNIGSMMYPCYFSDACECNGEFDKSCTTKSYLDRG